MLHNVIDTYDEIYLHMLKTVNYFRKNSIVDVLLGSKYANETCYNEVNLAAFSCWIQQISLHCFPLTILTGKKSTVFYSIQYKNLLK